MTKEYEIGINLIKKVHKELQDLLEVQDKLTARRIINAIINPITAAAYQIGVGNGPNKEEIRQTLLRLVKEMRDLSDINGIKEDVKKLFTLLEDIEKATVEGKEGA